LGKTDYNSYYKRYKEVLLPFYEGNYNVIAIEYLVHIKHKRKISRIFDKKFYKYHVMAGIFDKVDENYVPDTYSTVMFIADDEGKKFEVAEIESIEGDVVHTKGNVDVHITRIRKVLKEVPIAHEGKGESSWDCGENATYSCSMSSTKYQRLLSCTDAALEFWKSCMKDRIRYGGDNWIPQRFRRHKPKREVLVEKTQKQ
jgi:hypothetical protein